MMIMLVAAALDARKNSHAPISGFHVGAAIRSQRTGKIYSGCNVEDPAFNHTIHAEQGAIAQMVAAEGAGKLDIVVVVAGSGNTHDPISPCGHCRQLLVEMTDDNTPIFSYNEEGQLRGAWKLGELLPHAFRLSAFK